MLIHNVRCFALTDTVAIRDKTGVFTLSFVVHRIKIMETAACDLDGSSTCLIVGIIAVQDIAGITGIVRSLCRVSTSLDISSSLGYGDCCCCTMIAAALDGQLACGFGIAYNKAIAISIFPGSGIHIAILHGQLTKDTNGRIHICTNGDFLACHI